MFPVGLWHCTIHDFSFLSFRSLLSFHTLDSWRFTDTTWPFIAYISFYSHYSGWTINLVMHLSGLTNGAKWPLVSFFSLLVLIIPHSTLTSGSSLALENTEVVDIIREITRKKTFWISLKRRILLCRNICFWNIVSSKSEKFTYVINCNLFKLR